MTVSSGFFNSVNHDRLYDAEQLSSIFDGVIVDGVYENVGEAFNVTAYPDAYNTVLVGTGRAWFNHTWTLNDSRFSITLDPPNEMLGRIDAIVIDVNKERDTRKNSIIYLRGDEATPDFPPALINTENHHQYPIAYITRHAEQNGPISQSDIEITVGTGACPIATGVLEAQNLENLMQQLDSEFRIWWEGIKDLLDENTATNLQNQIDEINAKLDSDDALVGLLEKPIAEAFISGDYGISVSSYSVNTPYAYQEVLPTETFLPNGEMIVAYVRNDTVNTTQYKLYIVVTTPEGISTTKEVAIPTSYLSNNSQSSYTMNGHAVLINFNVDSYPVMLQYLLHMNDGYNRRCVDTMMTVKMSSSGTLDVTYSSSQYTSFLFSNVREIQPSMCTNIIKFDEIGAIVPEISYGLYDTGVSTHSYEGMITVFQITEDGLISSKKSTLINAPAGSEIYQFFPNLQQYNIYHLVNDKIINYLRKGGGSVAYDDQGARIIIDPETLDVVYVYNQASAYPPPEKFDYTVFKGCETYSISEQNGVTLTKIESGGSPEIVTEKRSPCFVGASNLGEALPEGTFIAAKDPDGRLYGIASSGEQLAIGNNGGAAILKTKKSVSTTIDISKVVLWLNGYINLESGTSYLITSVDVANSIYSHQANPMGYSANVSVVRISKGV